MEKLTVEVPSESLCIRSARCPAGHSLMAQDHLLGGVPAIRVVAETGQETGDVFLNAHYGNFEVETRLPVQDGEVYDMSCPTCSVSLRSDEERCIFCGAPMFVLHLPKGGQVHACARRACHNHKLKIVDVSAQLAELFELDVRPRF
jgi:ferredoxin